MAKKAGYFTENPKPRGKIVRALIPQIVESTESATEALRPSIPRSEKEHLHLRDTLKVDETKWGARVVLGDESRPEAAENFEFGNDSTGKGSRHPRKLLGPDLDVPLDGHRVLQKIAQRLESS